MGRISASIMPDTRAGWCSACLILAFFMFMIVFFVFVKLGERGGAGFFSNLKLTVPFLAAVLTGIFSFASGIVAIAKERERSLIVFASTLTGLFVLLWVLGEILWPH